MMPVKPAVMLAVTQYDSQFGTPREVCRVLHNSWEHGLLLYFSFNINIYIKTKIKYVLLIVDFAFSYILQQ